MCQHTAEDELLPKGLEVGRTLHGISIRRKRRARATPFGLAHATRHAHFGQPIGATCNMCKCPRPDRTIRSLTGKVHRADKWSLKKKEKHPSLPKTHFLRSVLTQIINLCKRLICLYQKKKKIRNKIRGSKLLFGQSAGRLQRQRIGKFAQTQTIPPPTGQVYGPSTAREIPSANKTNDDSQMVLALGAEHLAGWVQVLAITMLF